MQEHFLNDHTFLGVDVIQREEEKMHFLRPTKLRAKAEVHLGNVSS